MPKNLLARALDSVPQNPEDSVRAHYKKLVAERKQQGLTSDTQYVIQGISKSEGGYEVIRTGTESDLDELMKKAESLAFIPQGHVVVGTLEAIKKGNAKFYRAQVPRHMIEQEEAFLSQLSQGGGGYNHDPI
jgi:hypothetical protein